MRIVVVDFAASIGGGISILNSFYDYLLKSNDKNEWIFLLGDHYIEETENVKVVILKKQKKSRFSRLAFDFIYGRRLIKKLNPDAVFYLQNTLISGVKVPQIMYMDQSIPFQTEKKFRFTKKSEFKYAVYQYVIGKLNHKACKKANKTIVQTQWLKDAVISQCKIQEDRVVHIPPNCFSAYENYFAEKIDRTTFFYPASSAVYKNHKCIYDAIDKLDVECNVLLTLNKEVPASKMCKHIGTITQEQVYEIMQKSVLLFPSYIESYGLPLKEARSIGTLILASDTAFAREILDGYENAYFFNPFNPEELAVLMKKIVVGEIVHKKQIEDNSISSCNTWSEVIRVIEGAK